MKHRRRIRNANLLAAMARTGHNATSLAAATCLSPITISALVNRRRDPHPSTAAAIARALGVPAAELFTASEVA